MDVAICAVGASLQKKHLRPTNVLAHAAGGEHKIANYLAAHRLCNGTRWFYSPEEFRWILRIGKWARKHMEDQTLIGRQMSKEFLESENRVRERRSTNRLRSDRQLRAMDLFGKIDFNPFYDHKKHRKIRERPH